jgi:hypothetical protein
MRLVFGYLSKCLTAIAIGSKFPVMGGMERHIAVSYPEILASSLKMRDREFEREIKTISLVKLYDLGQR